MHDAGTRSIMVYSWRAGHVRSRSPLRVTCNRERMDGGHRPFSWLALSARFELCWGNRGAKRPVDFAILELRVDGVYG